MTAKNLKEQIFRVRIGPSPKFKLVDPELTIRDPKQALPSTTVFTHEGEEIVLKVPQLSHVNAVVQAARQEAEQASVSQ